MKGETKQMRETLEQTATECTDREFDEEFGYLVGFYRPCGNNGENRNAYKIVSVPFAHPENAEYNGV